MERVFNFSAGPSQMPLEVLEQAQRELLCYPGAGCSVMEMSHRSAAYQAIIDRARDTLRRLMDIPEDYEILFLQGGASLQFSMTAMNLARQGDTIAYAESGHFAAKACEEGARWGKVVIASSARAGGFTHIPVTETVPEDAAFLHITGNNTIFGTAYHRLTEQVPALVLPKNGFPAAVPLVADWSSAILGQGIDVKQYGLIYAGAQKNLGPAGLTVVIIRRDLLAREKDPVVPSMLRYDVAAKAASMYNTPPTYAIYMAGLMFDWVERQGGVAEMERRNREKAAMLYGVIDRSAIFNNPVAPDDRSIMNVVFTLPTEQDTADFLTFTKARGMISLKGHRLTGGLRASIYNGMPIEGVQALCEAMKDFEQEKMKL